MPFNEYQKAKSLENETAIKCKETKERFEETEETILLIFVTSMVLFGIFFEASGVTGGKLKGL